MKVFIKELKVEMAVKNRGIELEIRDNQDNHLGDCYITSTGIVWCRGRIHQRNGRKVAWSELINRLGA